MRRVAVALAAALTLAACTRTTHPEPDSAVMEPAADGSHWATPAGTRVYAMHVAGAVCFVAEARWAGHGAHGNVPPAISCLPAEPQP